MQEELNETNKIQEEDFEQEPLQTSPPEAMPPQNNEPLKDLQEPGRSSSLLKVTFVLALLALAGVIFLFARKPANHKGAAKPVFAQVEGEGNSGVTGTRIAFVRDDSIQNNYLMTIHFLDSIERRFKSMEGDLMAKKSDLEKRVNNYYRDIQSGILKENLALQIKEKIEAEGDNIAKLEAGYSNRINEMQVNLNRIYFDSLWNFIERHKAEFGVDMVVGYQQGMTNIFFADEALDITDQVIEMMNAEYIARYPDKKNLKKRKK